VPLGGVTSPNEANPFDAAEDDPLHDHVFEREGLERAIADLCTAAVAHHGEADFAAAVLEVGMLQKVIGTLSCFPSN